MAPTSPLGTGAGSRPINVPFLVGAAVLSGVGIFAMTNWIVSQDWLWFLVGVPTAAIGGLLLFHRATGADAA